MARSTTAGRVMLPPNRDGTAGGRRRVAYLWQLPTLLLAVTLVLLIETSPSAVDGRSSLWTGVVVIVLASVLALWTPWEWLGYRLRIVVPLLDLVGAAMVYDCTHQVLPSSLLLTVPPVVWLAAEFDLVGLGLGSVGVLAVAATPSVTTPEAPDTAIEWVDLGLPPVFCVCLGLLALTVSRLIEGTRRAVETRTDDLDLRLATLNGVLRGVDAGISIFVPGEPPLCNERALELAELGGIDVPALKGITPGTVAAALAVGGGDRVFGADGVTPVPAHEQAYARAARGESWSGRLHWVGAPGRQVAVLSSCHQMETAGGRHVGTVVVDVDATDIVESVRVREEFLTTVSHELRTPLTSVIGYLELLDEELGDGPRHDDGLDVVPLLAVVRRNAHVLLSRIDQLLDAAPGGSADLDLEAVDLSTLTRVALDKHRALAGREAIELRAEVPPGLVSVVDATAYEQVVDNLVSNAVKYTRPRGTVTVALDTREDSDLEAVSGPVVLLTVADTGVGMTPTECRQAFDRFYRSPFANDQAIPGLGIGLAITRQLVRDHGGDIVLESESGIGTVVTVVLPAAPTRTPQDTRSSSRDALPAS